MHKQRTVASLTVTILVLVSMVLNQVALAQANWTCDNGSNDVLNAAQAAFEKGDLAHSLELVKTAETVCASANALRAGQASILRSQIEQALASTAPAGQS